MKDNKERKRERTRAWRESKKHPCPECGKPTCYVSTYCCACKLKGDRSPSWNGGVTISGDGYRRIFMPDHPFANQRGYVAEHRLVMERHMGRTLLSTEVVHHVNGDKMDNRIENLTLFTMSEHSRHHWEDEGYEAKVIGHRERKGEEGKK